MASPEPPSEAQLPLHEPASHACNSAPATAAPRCARVRRHRCCIACGLISVLIVSVGAMLATFVFGPSIASAAIANSQISFTRLNISQPTDSFTFTMSSDLKVSKVAPLGCHIGEMLVTVMYQNRAFGSVHLPSMDIEAFKENHLHVPDQLFRVTDVHTWNAFAGGLLNNKTLKWRLQAKASITTKLFGLSLSFHDVPFDKEIDLTAFNGMEQVDIDVFDMSHSTPEDLLIRMSVCVKNPSDIVITDLGDLYLGIYYKGSYMGNVTAGKASINAAREDASDMQCRRFGQRAYNAMDMVGTLHPADHHVADELISLYFSGQKAQVSARALSPHADSLPLFDKALQGLNLSTALDGDQSPLITGLEFVSAMLTPMDNDHASMKMLAKVHLNDPLGSKSSLQISNVDMSVNMSYAGSLVSVARTGPTAVPPPNTVIGEGILQVPATVALGLPDKGSSLTKLAKDLIAKDVLMLDLHGATATDAQSSALGYMMHIKAVPVDLPNPRAKPPLGPAIVPGMNGLPDVQILGHTIPGIVPDGTSGCPSLCGVKLEITASVNNPSPFGMDVGTMNGQIQTAEGVTLGTVSTTGLSLKPGENVLSLLGKLAPSSSALGAAAEFLSAYLQNKAQATTVLGLDAGSSSVQWLQDVIRGLALKASFPGAGDGFSVLGPDSDILTLGLRFSDKGTPLLSGLVRAQLQMPAGVDLSIIKDVHSTGMQFDMIDLDSGINVGSLSAAAGVQYDGGVISATFESTPMTVHDTDGMSRMIKDLLLSKSKSVRMVGTVSPQTVTNMGAMQLQAVPFSSSATIFGFNSFADPTSGQPEMKVLGIQVVGAQGNDLSLSVDCEVTNPSNVAASMGKVSLEIWSDDNVKIGSLTLDDFSLQANEQRNAVTRFLGISALLFEPASSDATSALKQFLSKYLQGIAQRAQVRGASDGSGTGIPLLKPALAAFSAPLVVPGLLDHRLVSHAHLRLPNPLKLLDLPGLLAVHNPFRASIVLEGTNCAVYPCKGINAGDHSKCDVYWEEAAGNYTPEHIGETIPGSSTVFLKKEHPVRLTKLLDPEMIKSMFALVDGRSLIRLVGSMDISVGAFRTTVDYDEADVPVCLSLPMHPCHDPAHNEVVNSTLLGQDWIFS